MKAMIASPGRWLALVGILLWAAGSLAADKVPVTEIEQLDVAKVDRARALLGRAVAHYQRRGDKALADFGEGGRFQDGELYVYVLATDGRFLASGGSSSVLVGRNVEDMKDSAGKPFFREMIRTAREAGGGHVEYRWLNRLEKREERKLAFFKRVKDRILAVGFYIPRGTASQAQALLEDAVAALRKEPRQALADFGDINGRFVQDDLYVFVFGWDDLRMKAHGTMPHLVGGDGAKLTDANGRNIILEMKRKLENSERAEIDYSWRNPVTRQIEPKRSFVRRVDGYLVGVGFYPR